MLGNDALQPHQTSMAEPVRAETGRCRQRGAQQPGQVRLAHTERQPPKILAIADQDIEGVELDLGIVSARVQAVEIGPAINAEQHGFAIEDEGGVAVTERGL